MLKLEHIWKIQVNGETAMIAYIRQGNKYRIFLNDDHVTDIYRLPNWQMRFGMEAPFTIGTEQFLLVVWDDIPDLVWQGRMLTRDVEYAPARERRRANKERMYTFIAILGVVFLAGLAVYAYLGQVNSETQRVWTSLLLGSLMMINNGLYLRGKWIEQRP